MKLYLLPFLFILYSCSNISEIKEETNSSVTIKIPDYIDNSKLSKYSEFYDSVKMIPLETKEECLIGRIDKIVVYQGNFFILDQSQSKSVFQFDSKGKFIRRYGEIGDGPGKYNEPNDLSIKNDELVIWVNDFRKFIVFDLAGHFKREFHIDLFGKSGVSLGNRRYAIYSDIGADIDFEERFNLKIVSERDKKIEFGFEKLDAEFSKGLFFFQQSGDHMFISPGYSNTLYEITGDRLIKKVQFDLGTHTIPKDYYSKFTDVVKFKNGLNHTNYAYISTSFENNDFIVFSLVYKGLGYNCYYSKKTEQLKFGNNWFNNLYGFVSGGANFALDGNVAISIYDPSQIDGYQKAFKSVPSESEMKKFSIDANKFYQVQEKTMSEHFVPSDFKHVKLEIDFLHSVKVTDNPILILKNIKPF
ncbi:6-bladed beta-propeller [Sphingobacterium sp.]|uniref:6-bladed beta-propeller n=1 Tax=Sphingobacterium sp. TaxID=341027 RepID=UPI002582B84B|nr:6-bladed beta-propeller [Sphingobacterium sp.]WET69016.1 MAG: 6-bladed beta-propeller [Sphingobacterium sp.]